mmetsp:Transcript_18917/g.24332  ORF Transcript_18917/g.24332 Transcript_18917/m.24332 type:complete len:269 (-) Transcript_18917:184-990(-)
MNQFKRWVENSNGSSEQRKSSRPSLNLRTVNPYDWDESFSIVALNLLSRYEYFGMKPEDAILETLATARERFSFLEALNVRKHQHHLSPSTVNLVQILDQNFGRDLARMVEKDSPASSAGPSMENDGSVANSMATINPSNQQQNAMFAQHSCVKAQRKRAEERRSRSKGNTCTSTRGKMGKRAFFFPDTTGIFGVTNSKVTTCNIDWKLAEAIEQVSSLRLDGMSISPTATESTVSGASSSMSYEPPTVMAAQMLALQHPHGDVPTSY